MRSAVAAFCCATVAACSGSNAPERDAAPAVVSAAAASQEATTGSRTVRWSGTLEAVRSTRVSVPHVTGPTFRMTLTQLVPNGARVARGDVVADFDPVEQLDQARESAARYDDLTFQVRQREADNAASAERRRSEREQAEADLAKARLEVSQASVLSEREAEQNAIRAAKAEAQLESLGRTHPLQERADGAALRILELQRDRQRAAYDRAQANLEMLRVRAPIAGMVAHATFYNNGSMVRPQEGDQMTRNNTIMSIFDPGEMLVRVSVAEPDGALLHPGLAATVYVDAYPDMVLPAQFVTASPVAAAAGLGRGIKTFMAVFRLEVADPRLMPDLSAAVVFDAPEDTRARAAASDIVASAGASR
jgi:multidrug efflux pump subunit AcrA (membrane-fusion protein)